MHENYLDHNQPFTYRLYTMFLWVCSLLSVMSLIVK